MSQLLSAQPLDVEQVHIASVATVDNEPWNKMRGETARAYAAFLSYKALPARDRSLKKAVIAHYGGFSASKLRQYQTWSALHMWVDRASQWDQYIETQSTVAKLEQIKQMQGQHLNIAQALVTMAVKRLKNMSDLELTPADMLRFLDDGIRIQRLSLGEPDSIQASIKEETTEIAFTEMSDEQLIQRIVQLRVSKGLQGK